MPGESFRFIHASDFHLEAPLVGLDELPTHLKSALATAPRAAAQAIFDASLADNIDFLVLSGDLLNPTAAGPHGMSLLLDGFERLQAIEKPVFWAAGRADDPHGWPDAVPLPANVTLFPKDRAVAVPVQRAGRTICRVVGRSNDSRGLHVPSFQVDPGDVYTVAVGHGATTEESLSEARFDYWALGGEHNRRELCDAGAYSGTPQGRSLEESGAHGFTVIDVDAEANTRAHAVDCDQFRYCRVEIDSAEVDQVGSARNLLGERLVRLQHEHGGRHLLIAWSISVSDPQSLSRIGDEEELLSWLRREFGHGTPAAWSVSLSVRPPAKYPSAWQQEDTILGDFLRAASELKEAKRGAAQPVATDLNLLPFTEEHRFGEPGGLPTSAASLLADIPDSAKTEIFDRATWLGVESLRGGKDPSGQRS